MMLFTYTKCIRIHTNVYVYIQNDIATFIYAINSIRKLVRLAQVVEQWTGNPAVGG